MGQEDFPSMNSTTIQCERRFAKKVVECLEAAGAQNKACNQHHGTQASSVEQIASRK